MSHSASHQGHAFEVVRGVTHPEYSYFTFDGDEKEFRERHWNVQPGDVCIDIGAAYGAYTLAACAAGGIAHAFEPEPTVHADLVRNIELNGWQSRAHAVNAGCWNAPCNVPMGSYAPHWPVSTISGDYRMVTIDSYWAGRGETRLDWVKIDVEGAEVEALIGAEKTLRRFHPRIIVECHIFLKAELADTVQAFLRSVGYTEFVTVPREPCVMVIASAGGE